MLISTPRPDERNCRLNTTGSYSDQARPKLKENDQTFHTLSLRKEKKVGMFKKEVQLLDKVLEIELQDTATRDVAAKAKRRRWISGPRSREVASRA